MVSFARLGLLLAVAVSACRRPPARRIDTARTEAPAPQPSAQTTVPVPRSVSELDTLLGRLRSYRGPLREQGWEYDGKWGLFAALAALPDSNPVLADTAVARLVECIGRPEPAAATLDGRAISIGVLCYRALSVFADHEEAGPDGGLTRDWAGYLPPNPSAAQLQAAQRAWRRVVREKSYHTL